MKLLPRTTFGQIATALTLLLLANLVISFVVLRWLVLDPSAKEFANMIDNQTSLLRLQLEDFDSIQANNWLKTNMSDAAFLLRRDISSLAPLPDFPFYHALVEYSNVLKHSEQTIRLSRNNSQSWLWIKTSWMKDYTLGIPFRSYVQNIYRFASTVFIISTLISIIAAYLVTAYLLGPLKQLGKLAQGLPKMNTNLPIIKHKGPEEIQQVTTLVEDAARQMRKVVQDRELILAGVSHDLRSPLTCLRFSTEWVTDKKLQKEMIRDIETIDNIIDSFLSFMRAGENEKPERVNTEEFINLLLYDCKRRDQNIECLRLENITLSIRPLAISRLICNLIDNAFKHGQAPITLEAYRKNKQYQIWIKDKGNGIPSDEIENLLKPFVQAEISRTKYGSGLGLAIAKRITDTHKAKLFICNRKSGGLKAGIIFPV
jgi:two-component system osmolarity sensor histidine kinase EnvZ